LQQLSILLTWSRPPPAWVSDKKGTGIFFLRQTLPFRPTSQTNTLALMEAKLPETEPGQRVSSPGWKAPLCGSTQAPSDLDEPANS